MLGLIQIKQHDDTAAKPSGHRRPLFRDAMHWVRRIHLYSGLFMFPWVMLYGITAFLFNHPGALPDRPTRTLALRDFAGTPLESLADPAADAASVVTALNAKQSTAYRFIAPEMAHYTRDTISARARGDGQEHTVVFDVPSGTALVTTQELPAEQRAPFATRGLKAAGSLNERVKAALPQALTKQGLSADEAGIAVGTELVFFLEADGRRWKASYNIQTGALTGTPADSPAELPVRQFLTQLHLTHGYPSGGGIKWLWALGVDAMFASMVFWGVSGLLMGWQIKAVRRMGAITVAVSLAAACILAWGMHALFVS